MGKAIRTTLPPFKYLNGTGRLSLGRIILHQGNVGIVHMLWFNSWVNGEEKCDITLPWQQNVWITTMGNLSNDDGGGNENVKKGKQQPCTCITLFCTFLSRPCKTATWNFLISRARFMWYKTQKLSFSLSNLDTILWDSTPGNFAKILTN